jgi:hypothetical protein
LDRLESGQCPARLRSEVAIDDQRVTLEAKEVLQDARQLGIAIGQARFQSLGLVGHEVQQDAVRVGHYRLADAGYSCVGLRRGG